MVLEKTTDLKTQIIEKATHLVIKYKILVRIKDIMYKNSYEQQEDAPEFVAMEKKLNKLLDDCPEHLENVFDFILTESAMRVDDKDDWSNEEMNDEKK